MILEEALAQEKLLKGKKKPLPNWKGKKKSGLMIIISTHEMQLSD